MFSLYNFFRFLSYSDGRERQFAYCPNRNNANENFSPRPLISFTFPVHLSVLPWPFLIIRFLRLLVICIRARGCNWDALHSRLAMISPVKIHRCCYPKYISPYSLTYVANKENDKCNFHQVTKNKTQKFASD